MPERITKDGIQHIPRRRRAQPVHPLLIVTSAAGGLVLAVVTLFGAVRLAAGFPEEFPCLCAGAILLMFVCAGLIPFIQARR